MNTTTLDACLKRAKAHGHVVLYVPPQPRPTGHPNEVPYTFSFMDPPPEVKP